MSEAKTKTIPLLLECVQERQRNVIDETKFTCNFFSNDYFNTESLKQLIKLSKCPLTFKLREKAQFNQSDTACLVNTMTNQFIYTTRLLHDFKSYVNAMELNSVIRFTSDGYEVW